MGFVICGASLLFPVGITPFRSLCPFKVKIDEKMHAKIVDELEAKLASGEIVDDEAQTVEAVEAGVDGASATRQLDRYGDSP
ncbi:hypothetical protein BIFLH23_01080 [Bifidobacterium longum subsp. infantis]|uniref:Uncharacterized protein n=1 Tax=Bifidobacterium longum subsp. infantis TaxID=1682 RepID=A0A8U0LCW8_BIFLI|nr:hypothetical protein [Bifidobacterium longum]VWQ35384.1 hypothetical protein BIFLH23_01080 [Bifidobacterium longum subsp. infantis]